MLYFLNRQNIIQTNILELLNSLHYLENNNENNVLDLIENELNENIRYIQHQLNTNVLLNVDNNNFSFPSIYIIERIFTDYNENKDKISIEEFNDSIIKLNNKIDECSICYNSSEKSIKIKKCKHTFCETCITKWLLENKYTCPTCRIDVRK